VGRTVDVNIVCDDRFLPKYMSEGAACADLYANIPPNLHHGCNIGSKISLKHRYPFAIKTGIFVEAPVGYKLCIAIRSGLARRGLMLLNGVGIIDSDFRGEVEVLVVNAGAELIEIKDGDRIAQCWVEEVRPIRFNRVEKLSETKRGAAGFGSTGVR
jgi:dUTP pyrophosphatase